jgi:MFS family permease
MLALGIGFAGWGHVVDRYGPVKCVYACIAVVGFRPLIYAAAGSYGWLFPAAILGGLSDSGIEIGYLNSILSFSPPTLIPSYQSLHATLLGIRGVLSMFLAGAMCTALQAHHLGYRPAFILSTIMIFSGLWLGRKVNTR